MGPIIIDVVPKNYEEELWLQQHVATNTALKSFIVTSKEDFDILYCNVREREGLPICIMSTRDESEKPSQDSELILETLRSHVDPKDIDGEAGVYGMMALLLFFEEDSRYDSREPGADSDDEHAESGLKLKKHN